MKTKWVYDDAYDKSIPEWEDFLRNTRLPQRRQTWYLALVFPFLLIGYGFAGSLWTAWVGVLGLYLIFVYVFSFFVEINENIRYTRQLVIKRLKYNIEK